MEKFLISKKITLREALIKMDDSARKILFVIEENKKLFGTLSDGDIRRWILNDGDLRITVDKVCCVEPFYVNKKYDIKKVKNIMLSEKIECVPVINNNKEIIELLFWSKIFNNRNNIDYNEKISCSIVIMAGGKGTRMDPFTRILPKPLIPIGDKTILELIIENFTKQGANNFYLTLNYKSKIIKAYFEELDLDYNLEFIEESKPLGTVGSLKYLEEIITEPFIVVNCDTIINANYGEILDFHNNKNNDMTLITSLRNFKIPFGVCEIGNGGDLLNLSEKPEHAYLVNTGIYVINPDILKYIPYNKYFDITDLISSLKDNNLKIGIFPVSENSWIDTGDWNEFENAEKKFKIKYD